MKRKIWKKGKSNSEKIWKIHQVTSPEATWFFPRSCFPYFSPRTFFPYLLFTYFFSRIFCSRSFLFLLFFRILFPYFIFPYLFHVLFFRIIVFRFFFFFFLSFHFFSFFFLFFYISHIISHNFFFIQHLQQVTTQNSVPWLSLLRDFLRAWWLIVHFWYIFRELSIYNDVSK
jgi:hypothetical protein